MAACMALSQTYLVRTQLAKGHLEKFKAWVSEMKAIKIFLSILAVKIWRL
jgi:hypothetical protein